MIEQRQPLVKEVDVCVASLRDVLLESSPPSSHLIVVQSCLENFNKMATNAESDSFRLIGERLANIFARFVAENSVPTPLEREMIELAADWLAQLATLYSEAIPEPRTLVSELIYTFDLVERSRGAASLAALMVEGEESLDLFDGDPELTSVDSSEKERRDPFDDDPGFGLEFDLLQRALSRAPAADSVTIDPFGDDPRLSEETEVKAVDTVAPPYDVFADDPPLSEPPK